jgi:Transposase DDE domain
MATGSGAVHVTTQRRHYTGKDGRERVYETHLLRRSWREGGKVRNETVANLSRLPAETVELIRRSLAGERFIPASAGARVARSLPHGHAAAVHVIARTLRFPALLGPPGPDRDLAYALIISRVLRPASKLSTIGWWDDVTLGPDLGVAGASTDDVYAAMDWLVSRQDGIEKELARRHLAEGGIAMFDLSSSWVEGSRCELAACGYSRDGKKGKAQIEYGLLTDSGGRPVAVRVFAGNTGDPKTFPEAVSAVRGTFGLKQMIMVGDRGMITSARISDLRQLEGMAWITCLRGPAIKNLMAGGGPLQLSLFDEQDLAEISSPDYPGERLIACRNPFLAAERARKRADLLQATEDDLGKIAAQVAAGRIKDPDKIGLKAGRIINKRKVAKHFTLDITEGRITWQRDQASIGAEALTDGIYVIRTPVPAETLDAAGTVATYKRLSALERDFRSMKADDLDLRPIWHRLEDRVKAHVLICMLACYLSWHLRQAWAPLTYADEHPPARANPVAPARRSPSADAKAAAKTGPGNQALRSFRGLLTHLATLTRNDLHYGDATIPGLAEPTHDQRRAFDLIGAAIPLTLNTT